MALTLQTAVTEVRMLLQDAQVPYRHADSVIVSAFNLAIADARRLRPDLFLLDSYSRQNTYATNPKDDYPIAATTATTYFTEADLLLDPTPDFPIEDGYVPAMIEYVVGYISMSDDEYTVDGRGAALLGRFAAKIGGI